MKIQTLLGLIGLASATDQKIPYGDVCQAVHNYKLFDFQPLDSVGSAGEGHPSQLAQKKGGYFLYDICKENLELTQNKLDEIEAYKGSNNLTTCDALDDGNAYFV